MKDIHLQGTLEICERIAEIDRERARLVAEIERRTGKSYDEFLDGMRQLFEHGMTIAVVDDQGRAVSGPMTPAEFLDREGQR